MAQITAALVKELREKTGAGMMDCKKALTDTDGDMEAAVDWLRKKGLSQAAKKAGRAASDGLVGVATEGNRGALVEVNSETDFVARNEQFQSFVSGVARLALEADGDIEVLKTKNFPGTGRTVEDELTNLIATIGENMSIRRCAAVSVPEGVVAAYVHSAVSDGLGKIGVLVGLQSEGNPEKLTELGRSIAMHVAATQPEATTVDQLDPALVERERRLLADQAKASGKPDNIIDKMVEGRLRKFYEEVVLTEQIYVIDQERRVSKVLSDAEAEVGAPATISRFERFTLGEGLEVAEKADLASEVSATLGG